MTVGELIMRLQNLDRDKQMSLLELLNILNDIYIKDHKSEHHYKEECP